MYKNTKNVDKYIFGNGSIIQLNHILKRKRNIKTDHVVFIIDHYFQNHALREKLPIENNDQIYFLDTTDEPDTTGVDSLCRKIKESCSNIPVCIIGIGGGSTLDTAKAVSNLLTNFGKAEDYQGWDLVREKGVYKIGIPTLSGTGAESSRTCVLSNSKRGIKLGMNSDFSVFDQLILDPDLLISVPIDQFFFTGMDTYLHCMESLNGSYRNAIVDALAEKALQLCKDVFLSDDMKSEKNREKMMVASYLGGCSAGNVGVVHPISAGLSVVLKLHHGIANCHAMTVLDEFYPNEFEEFQQIMFKHKISLPQSICKELPDEKLEQLYNSSIIHANPLKNALGDNFKEILTKEKVIQIYKRM